MRSLSQIMRRFSQTNAKAFQALQASSWRHLPLEYIPSHHIYQLNLLNRGWGDGSCSCIETSYPPHSCRNGYSLLLLLSMHRNIVIHIVKHFSSLFHAPYHHTLIGGFILISLFIYVIRECVWTFRTKRGTRERWNRHWWTWKEHWPPHRPHTTVAVNLYFGRSWDIYYPRTYEPLEGCSPSSLLFGL